MTRHFLEGNLTPVDWMNRLFDVAWGLWSNAEIRSYRTGGMEEFSALREGRQQAWIEGCQAAKEVLGNPFRPVSVPPHWLTPAVVGLAGGIYDDRAFDRLPILADALLDAGCENDQILSHCRSEGSHVRGCWAIDLLLGKS